MSASSTTRPKVRKQFSSSILLWVRNDQPRQTGMDHWKGPHSKIVSANSSLKEYRQIHLAEVNPGRWPATDAVETTIPSDRKIDGIAEVALKSVLAALVRGRKQTAMAYKDEINVFRRTLLYAGLPNWSRWYDVAPGDAVGSRAVIYIRRRDDVGGRAFRTFVNKQLVSSLTATGGLKELRTQTFLPWNQKLWDTPNVAHDNPKDQRLHASVMLGFADDAARDAFFAGDIAKDLSAQLAPLASAIHAYDVAAALTYVRDGHALSHYEE